MESLVQFNQTEKKDSIIKYKVIIWKGISVVNDFK